MKKLVKGFYSILAVFLILLVFLLLVFGGVFVVMKIFCNQDESIEVLKPETYRYYSTNPERNEWDSGFLTSYNHLAEEEYRFSEHDGTYTLVSNFMSTEYQCFGTCFCKDESSRREALPISRGLIYLAASLTPLVAYEAAGKYFQEKCETSLSDHCSMSTVESRVDECEPVSKEVDSSSEGEKKEIYECTGSCLKNDPFIEISTEYNAPDDQLDVVRDKFIQTQTSFEEEYGECKELTLTKQINVNDVMYNPDQEHSFQVKLAFTIRDLDVFCKQRSMREYMRNEKNIPVKGPMCVGYDHPSFWEMEDEFRENFSDYNPSVKCVLQKKEV